MRYSDNQVAAEALAADIKEARKLKKKTKKTFVSIKFVAVIVYLNKLTIFNLKVRENLLTSNLLASAQSVREIIIDPSHPSKKINFEEFGYMSRPILSPPGFLH